MAATVDDGHVGERTRSRPDVALYWKGPSRLAEQRAVLRRELHRGQEIVDAVARQRPVDRGEMGARLVEPAGERQAVGGDRQDVRMRIRARGRLDAPVGGLVEPAETHQRHGAGAEHAEQQRVERAEMARVVGAA